MRFEDLEKNNRIGSDETLIVLENDLSRFKSEEKIDFLFKKFNKIIVIGHSENNISPKADILIPSGTFAESTGTVVNNEGRAQRYYRVLPESGSIRDSWKYLAEMIEISGNGRKWEDHDDLMNSFVDDYPLFLKLRNILPDSQFRYFSEKIARQTPRYSGRTAMNSNNSVSESSPPEDKDSPLKFSMEGYKGIPGANLTPYYWSPGWNSPQAINKYLDEPAGDPEGGNPGALLF